MRRRELLKLMGLAPLAIAVEALPAPLLPATAAIAAPAESGDTVEALEDLATRYRSLYHSTPPAELLTPVRAHLRTSLDLLKASMSASQQTRLLRNHSEVATLAGRLSFFDLHDAQSARHYLGLAVEAAREAQDDVLAALALGHAAFLPAKEGRCRAASDYLGGASHSARRVAIPAVEAWLAAVEAEVWTAAGDEALALRSVERAEAGLSQSGSGTSPPACFDYFDAVRLNGFKGAACHASAV